MAWSAVGSRRHIAQPSVSAFVAGMAEASQVIPVQPQVSSRLNRHDVMDEDGGGGASRQFAVGAQGVIGQVGGAQALPVSAVSPLMP